MALVTVRRALLLALAGTVSLSAGCGAPKGQAREPWQCQSDGTAATAFPATPTAFGVAREVTATPGFLSLAVTGVRDPLPGGDPGAGCQFIGVGVRLRNTSTVPVSIDFFKTTV